MKFSITRISNLLDKVPIPDQLYERFGKKKVHGALILGALLIISVLGTLIFQNGSPELPERTNGRVVLVQTVAELASSGSIINTVGTVRAISEARLETESSGRVTAVNVGIGDRVAAGTVIAAIENAREHASLLQAEGAYEAALANTAEAETDAANVYREAYIVANNAIRNLVDELFVLPESNRPRLLLNKSRFTSEIEDNRVIIGELLKDWEWSLFSDYATQRDGLTMLETAEEDTDQIVGYMSRVIEAVARQNADERFSESDLASYRSRLFTAQTALNRTLADIQDAIGDLFNAQVGNKQVSTAFAAVKQALGALRAAQASYEETLIRTPIAGVVNAMYLHEGEYVGVGNPAAVVANNDALEISAYVTEEHAKRIAIGDIVQIDGERAGTVARIAPAIDPITKKIEVKITVSKKASVANGDTVRIALATVSPQETVSEIFLPLRSIRFTGDNAAVFRVIDGILVEQEIELGEIRADTVEIVSGITPEDSIVTDARGLRAGERVSITN